MSWEKTLQCLFACPLLAGAVFAQDSDLDGIPDAWESSHYLDPDNDSDAHLDFDRDGLDSLQEYQLSLLGKGTGLKGKWSAILVNPSQIGSMGVIAINDDDDVLVNVTGYPTSSAWVRKNSDGTWKQISTINGTPAFIQGLDLNNEGQVVGRARPTNGSASTYFGFIKDLNVSPYDTNVSPWFSETDSTTPVKSITAINNWGDVIGRRADNSSFLQSRFYGEVSPPSTWNSPVFTALNDWGQVIGIELSDPNFGLDIWSHFLLSEEWTAYIPFPGYLFSEYGLPDPGTEEWMFDSVSYTPSLINDWGEFAGKFSVFQGQGENPEVVSSYWFYDGTADPSAPFYRPMLPLNYERQVIHALNNWPQMIVTGIRPVPWAPDPGEPQEYYPPETFLCVGDIRVPLSAIAPVPSVVNEDSFQVIGINNRSTILASVGSSIYLLRLNQDADGDQIPDDWEEFHGMNPLDPSDAGDDDDGDGYSNITEYRLGGDPSDNSIHERPVDGVHRPMVDGDGDGLPDAWERKFFPGLTREQVMVAGDPDNDLLTNGQEWLMETDPTKRDTDRDGAHDGDEIYWYLTDARNPDSDGDGIVDGDEATIDTDPLDPNSNGVPPTFLNIAEKVTFYDPNIHFGNVWVNWLHNSPPVLHQMKENPNDLEEPPNYPTYDEVEASHETFNYTPLSDQTPFTMSYPSGQADYNPELAYQYGSDGFMGGGYPTINFGAGAPQGGFGLRYWKVRAERKSASPAPAVQTWVVAESDADFDELQDIQTLRLEIEENGKISDEVEIKPSAVGRLIRLLPVELRDISRNQVVNDVAWIKGHKTSAGGEEPEMPKLEVMIVGLPYGTQVEWKLENRYPRRDGRDDFNFPGGGAEESGIFVSGNESWKIWQTMANTDWPFFGGNIIVKFRVHGEAGPIGGEGQLSFKILGENPDDARCKAHIIANQGEFWYAWAVARHESKDSNGLYNQFASGLANGGVGAHGAKGDPFYAASEGDGWGLFQRDSASGVPVTTLETWSWDRNMKGFLIDEHPEQLSIANTYVNSVASNNPATFEEPQFVIKGVSISGRHVLALTWYNGPQGRPNSQMLRFDGSKSSGQRWSLNLPNAPSKDQPYVHEIMDEYNGG